MSNFTPYTSLLMGLLSDLEIKNEPIILHRELRLLPLLSEALKLVNGDEATERYYPEYIKAKIRRERNFLERVSFIGSTEFILFDVIYGSEMKLLHSYLSDARMNALQLNLKTILDEHIYSRGELRAELTQELNRASEYLYSAKAQSRLEVRVLSDISRNRQGWLELYPEKRDSWQSSVDELFIHWELSS